MTASATTQLTTRSYPLARLAHAVQQERVLIPLAFAAIGLHLADDNFLQPEPGMSAGDHLVSGLVPLLLLTVAALAYGRVSAGARATLALLAGYFGVLVGTEAVYYASAGALSGDDYTGFLSLVCGFLLLVAGSVMLWRSRRRNDSVVRRCVRRALIVIGVLAAIAVIVFPASLAYVATHTLRAEVPKPELGAPHEDVVFKTSDGLRLEGWFVPSRNGATVIVVPGPLGSAKADADARASRLRRPPLRPSRRGSKRRRPERLRLGRRP